MTVTPFDQPTEMLPIPNVPLLNKVREHIEDHPEEWDQYVWRSACGTTYCFAGLAALFDGAEWAAGPGGGLVVTSPDGEECVASRAQRALGLTADEAQRLFETNNKIGDIDRHLAAIYARAGETP